MRKLTIARIALEAAKYEKTFETGTLPSGWEDTLHVLVEQGPVFAGDVPSKIALDALQEEGYVTRVVSKGTEPEENIFATLKGRDLYIQSVFGSYDDHTLEEAITQREEAIKVSTEGFLGAIGGFLLGASYLPAIALGGAARSAVNRKQKEIEAIAAEIKRLATIEGKAAIKEGRISAADFEKHVNVDTNDIVSGTILGILFGPFYLAFKGSQLQDRVKELKTKTKELEKIIQENLKEYKENVIEPASKKTEVSNEGFVDWVKDIFTFKLTSKDVDTCIKSNEKIKDFVNKNKGKKLFLDPNKSVNETIVFLFFKNSKIANNIATELTADAKQIIDLNKALNSSLGVLKKLDPTDADFKVQDIISKNYKSELVNALHGTRWLNSITLTTNKKGKLNEIYDIPEDYYDASDVIVGYNYDVQGNIVGSTESILTKDGEKKTYIRAINDSLDNAGNEFYSCLSGLSKELDTTISILKQISDNIQRLKKSDSSVTRSFIRQTHNLTLTAVSLIEQYGVSIAELNN